MENRSEVYHYSQIALQQIEELNKIVLNYCIQQVYGEAQGYLKYIDDASTLVVPIAHPVMANNTDRTLELKTWFGNKNNFDGVIG